MKIKQRPEDFSVKESYRFDEVPNGRFRVYLMDKQKLSTFDAVDRLRARFGLNPGTISFCGLKDKQGRTEQLIAVDGYDVDLQEPDLRLKFLGYTNKALSARNITSNRFSVTVRALTERDLAKLNLAAAEVNRLGVVNYFDNQRFGSLKHGQGFIAKDLLRGDFEAALRNYLAKPSPLDRSDDGKVKAFWQQNWGKWLKRPPFAAAAKYDRVIRSLKEKPDDYLRAFLQIDADYRAMQLFTYQSFLWNEGVRRLMQLELPREALFPLAYQAGTLLLHRDAPVETLQRLRTLTFPLLAPETTLPDPKVREAVEWILGKEKLTLDQLKIEGGGRLLYFKHEERPVMVHPHKLVLGRHLPDDLNPGYSKLNVAFTLPPGAYATLIIKRLFHFSYRDDTVEEIKRSQDTFGSSSAAPVRPPRGNEVYEDDRGELSPAAPPARPARTAERFSGDHPGSFARPAAAAEPGPRFPRTSQRAARAERAARAHRPDAAAAPSAASRSPSAVSAPSPATSGAAPGSSPVAEAAPEPRGFRARQQARKSAKQDARERQPPPKARGKRGSKPPKSQPKR